MSEKIVKVGNLRFSLDSWGFGDWGWQIKVGTSLMYWIWSVCKVFGARLMMEWGLKFLRLRPSVFSMTGGQITKQVLDFLGIWQRCQLRKVVGGENKGILFWESGQNMKHGDFVRKNRWLCFRGHSSRQMEQGQVSWGNLDGNNLKTCMGMC